jgi:AcrR family transcriptional regulator
MPADRTRTRADATRNRQAIVAAARSLYRERGLDTPLDDIARLAEVGNATLYRHFPTRCALVAAVFADALVQVEQAAAQALADPDPWNGFAGCVKFLCHLQASDRAIADLLTTEISGAPEIERLRASAYRGFVRVTERAKNSAALRTDFVSEDLVLLLMANAGLAHRTAQFAPTAWDRFSDIVLDGLRAKAATPAARTPGRTAVRRAMREHGDRMGFGTAAC